MKDSLRILPKAFIAFSLFLILSNSAFSQTNVSGVISSNTTWTKAASPYNVTGNILVNSGVVLTINDGVTIKVNGDYYIKIEGNLNAVGTTNSKIIFESNSQSPTRRNWQGIQIRPTGGSTLNSDQSYLSGTRLKNVVIKNATKGVYVYGTGIHISDVEFNENDFGVEIRSSVNVVLDNNRFVNNNYGIYTEYEAYGGDGTSNIENTYILNNTFSSNTNGAYFFLNQRQFKNLNIKSNLFDNNTIGLTFSGGGYGCSVQSATISQNTFLSNQTYGLKVGQIMSQASDARTPYAFIVEKNSFIDNGVYWEYGGGAGGATSSFSNNVISTKNGTSLVIKGESSRSDLFSKNYIYSNINAISVQPLFANSYFPSNKTISYNSIRGNSSNALVKLLGSNMVFNNNNFRPYTQQILLKVDGTNDINSNNNYWGTTDLSKINEGIFDKSDNFELGQANIANILNNLESGAPIFPVNNVSKSISNGRIVLSWTANQESDIAGYKVYYGGFTGYSYTNSVDAGNVLTYTLPAGVGIDEDIAVTAYDASKDGTDDQFDGNESWYSPANKAPVKPVISSITPSERKIDIAWGAIANTDKYNVYKSLDGVTYTLQASVKTTSYSHTNLNTLQQRYYYKVAAFDSLDLSYTSYGLEGSSSDVSDSKPTNKGTISSVETANKAVKLNLTYNSLISNITNYKIYRSSASETRQLIKTLEVSNLFYVDSVRTDKQYTYDITISNSTEESDPSVAKSAISFSVSALSYPVNNQLNVKNSTSYKWIKSALADRYIIEVDTTILFNSLIKKRISVTDTSYTQSDFIQNRYYYWRIKTGDINGLSDWSEIRRLQTFVEKPIISEAKPSNRKSLLKFTIASWNNIKKLYILRDTLSNPIKIIDSSNVEISQYLDTLGLKLNKKYYYTLRLINNQGVESDLSIPAASIPFNLKPQIKSLLDKTFNNAGEYNFVRSVYSSSGSKDLDGKITNYKWFVNDNLVNATDSILVYYFRHGTHSVKLVIADNDGDKDSSTANVSLNSFVKTFKGGFLGGITALNPNVIYTADSNYDPISGASVSMLDRLGNSVYPLVVSSKIFTTPSVATDSSVFITSGSSLNGFNKSGAPLWSTIPLGGLSYVTPTIDSLFNRIYVGVSNKNFLAIDYKTGKVAWNIIGDAAINSSAVITGDRKLIFTSQAGTLYGFDIKSNDVQTVAKWKLNLGEVVSKSPAVDRSNNLYIGTESGNLLKIRFNTDGTIEQLWKTNLVSSLQVSPVIDADGNVYIGNKDGSFFKVNQSTGVIIWKYETGAEIKSTPSISEFGNIYVANMSGLTFALNSNKELKWKYQADGPISANILYINNMLYLGTESGKLIALYDNPATNTLNTGLSTNAIITSKGKQIMGDNLATSNRVMNQTLASSALKEPVWGTFQGNYRRSGSKSFECPSTPKLFVPSCTDLAETIKVSTDNMVNRYWVINDQIQKSLLDSAIIVKVTDKVKIMAYNSVGCNVYSETPIKLLNAVISKPQIVTNTGTTKFCEGTTIILNSKDSYKNYQWNFSTYAISGSTDKTLSTTLPGAYSITAINEFGCKATSDVVLILTTPTPIAPTIAIESKATLVSNYTGITWFKDGVVLPDTSQKINLKADGLYTAKITKNGCVSPLSNSIRYSSFIVLGVNKEVQFTLSPNPFIAYLKIEFPEKFGPKVDVKIYSLTGNVVWESKDLFSGDKINLESFNQGMYLIKLINSSGESLESKVIKL